VFHEAHVLVEHPMGLAYGFTSTIRLRGMPPTGLDLLALRPWQPVLFCGVFVAGPSRAQPRSGQALSID
jgi:hypothetical protein